MRAAPRPRERRVCVTCGTEFLEKPSRRVTRCSRACMHAAHDPNARFWAKVQKSDGCWLWTGVILSTGYGQFTIGRKRDMAHRVSYEFEHGQILEGLQIDHLCRIRACVNPAHLEAVTLVENNRRSESYSGRNARKTHCLRGHLLDGKNLFVDKRGFRRCRQCMRIWDQSSKQRRRRAACLPIYEATGRILVRGLPAASDDQRSVPTNAPNGQVRDELGHFRGASAP